MTDTFTGHVLADMKLYRRDGPEDRNESDATTSSPTEGQLTASVWRPLISHDQVDSGHADLNPETTSPASTSKHSKSDEMEEWECDVCHDINKGWKQNCELCWRAKASALLSNSQSSEDNFSPVVDQSPFMERGGMTYHLPPYPTNHMNFNMNGVRTYVDRNSHVGPRAVPLDDLGMPLHSEAIVAESFMQKAVPHMKRGESQASPRQSKKKPKLSKKAPPKPKKPKMKKPKPKIPKIFNCPDCDKIFHDSKSFRLHTAQHKWGPHAIEVDPETKKTQFRCLHPGCNKVVRDRKVLRKHLLTHREKQFKCHYEGCGKKFYERAKLKRHFLVHTGDKPFKCPYIGCGKPFGYKANLKTHMRTHTGQRPFACTFPGCDRRFAQASNRNSHVLTHQKNCPVATSPKDESNQSDPKLSDVEASVNAKEKDTPAV